jgi:hypothetical protein
VQKDLVMQVNLEEIEVMNLTSKSIIVYRCSEPINRMQIERLNKNLRKIFPNNTVLVMDKTSELSIIEENPEHLGLCCEIEMPKND